MRATTELAIRKAALIATWAIITLFGAGCAIALFVSVAEHPVVRTLLLAIMGLFALAALTVFVFWAIGDVNRMRIEELEQDSERERYGEIDSR